MFLISTESRALFSLRRVFQFYACEAALNLQLLGLPLNFDPQLIRAALAEDVGAGDVTTAATVPADTAASAVMVAREPLVVCGLSLAEAVFKEVSAGLNLAPAATDGQRVAKGQALLNIQGPARASSRLNGWHSILCSACREWRH